MDEEEYLRIQSGLVIQAQGVAGLDLKGFLQLIERAEAVGPILDPSFYRLASGKLDNVKRLAKAARVFQDEMRRQVDE